MVGTEAARCTGSRWNRHVPRAALLAFGTLACVREAQLDQQIARIGHSILEAEAAGALRCAPRELAVARSQLRFAELERAQGFTSKAEEHLQRADQHARAARLLSPSEHCRPRPPERPDGPASRACVSAEPACSPW